MSPPTAVLVIDRLAYSPAEAARALGISRARLYQLLDDGTIPSVKLGRRRLIRCEALVDLLAGLESGGAPSAVRGTTGAAGPGRSDVVADDGMVASAGAGRDD